MLADLTRPRVILSFRSVTILIWQLDGDQCPERYERSVVSDDALT
jgi:hypothetical protein